jgi:hypothetical protein
MSFVRSVEVRFCGEREKGARLWLGSEEDTSRYLRVGSCECYGDSYEALS